MLATTRPRSGALRGLAPSGSRLEVKYDGFRALAGLSGGEVALISRNQIDFGPRYPRLVRALSELPISEAVLDGEVVGLDSEGRSRFALMGRATGHHYVLFDVLWWEGRDVRALPLRARLELLEALGPLPPPLASAQVLEGPVTEALRRARTLGLEGLIMKRLESPYRGGRSKDWLKLKVQQRQELIVVGWTPLKNGVPIVGALLLAVRAPRGRGLRYAGKVGTGFDDATRASLARRLAGLARLDVPVSGAPRFKTAHWVQPDLVVEVAFTEWTPDGRLRHPVYLGVREDKAWETVVREPTATSDPLG